MALDNNSDRTLKDVFDQYSSGDNYDFSKTVVPLRLARFEEEKPISRSQAKKALAWVERFRAVVFDFAGIEMIGPAFADEIFRVWARAHADVECMVIDASPAVRKMIAAVGPATNVKLPIRLGRLPGDIYIHGKNSTFYFPLATCILISVLVSLLTWIFRK
jgi:hypothetical protein